MADYTAAYKAGQLESTDFWKQFNQQLQNPNVPKYSSTGQPLNQAATDIVQSPVTQALFMQNALQNVPTNTHSPNTGSTGGGGQNTQAAAPDTFNMQAFLDQMALMMGQQGEKGDPATQTSNRMSNWFSDLFGEMGGLDLFSKDFNIFSGDFNLFGGGESGVNLFGGELFSGDMFGLGDFGNFNLDLFNLGNMGDIFGDMGDMFGLGKMFDLMNLPFDILGGDFSAITDIFKGAFENSPANSVWSKMDNAPWNW